MDWGHYDVVVAGGGIAGALIVDGLCREGRTVAWIAPRDRNTSTRACAGVINPITGRKFTWSWKFDTIQDVALSVYKQIQEQAGKHLLFPLHHARVLATTADCEQWAWRRMEPPYSYVMGAVEGPDRWPWFQSALAIGRTHPVWRVDAQGVVDAVARIATPIMEGHMTGIRTATIGGEACHVPDGISVIHATGWQGVPGMMAPLPIWPFKGEAILVRSEDWPRDTILHHRVKVVPWHQDIFWVGSQDHRTWDRPGPDPATRIVLEDQLRRFFRGTWHTEEVMAGIRPSTPSRRPFAGAIPGIPDTWVVNGLGTKGASLAPWVSRQLIRKILFGEAIDPALGWPWN
ncbi:MAG: FAD-binding oxidoreductase [Saprospiraceae bacterium]|nr:FAD-binding oxidoreductase [Saprospiraceae bacterium]